MSIGEELALRFVRLMPMHLPMLTAIEEEAYPDPWTLGMFRQELENTNSHFFTAYRGEELIGYGGFWLVLDEAHITKVTVAAAYRGQGLGRAIMGFLLRRSAEAGANTVRLEVRETNYPARRLYESLGFTEVARREGYYARTNETAVIMVRATNRAESR
jgi:ribosomal-protein-alanine N-acetyltransferase